MKYSLGQVVYYLMNNKIHNSAIFAKMKVQTTAGRVSQLGKPKELYETAHAIFSVDEIFTSKEDLVESLLK